MSMIDEHLLIIFLLPKESFPLDSGRTCVLLLHTEVAWTIHQTYLNGTEEEKQELETKYSQKQLRKLVKELGINAGNGSSLSSSLL